MDTLTKAFLEWANGKGYDTAHAYNHNKGRWIFLSPMTAGLYEAWQAAPSVPVVERQDCGTCENRGRVNGLSQETFCEHCSWSEKWRKNNYKPIAIAGEKK